MQLRGTREKNLMWQKERLLNIGLKHLPPDCDKVAWLDCDIIFKNGHWIKETSELLEKYIVVQPFEKVVRLNKDEKSVAEKVFEDATVDCVSICYGTAYTFVNMLNRKGLPGYICTFRREVLRNIGFCDFFILGGGDLMMMQAIQYGNPNGKTLLEEYSKLVRRIDCNSSLFREYKQWSSQFNQPVNSSLFFASGTILHLWHGKRMNRMYEHKFLALESFNFNPSQDIRVGSNNLWEWSSDKPALHKTVAEYFHLRNEEKDNITLVSIILDELSDTQTRLKDTQTRLKDTQTRLKDTQTRLKDTQTRLARIEASRSYKLARKFRQISYVILPSPKIRQLVISSALFMWKRIRVHLFITQGYKNRRAGLN